MSASGKCRAELAALSLCLLLPAVACGRSTLEGLEIVESEKGGGVEILSCEPSSPAAQAMLRAGDRITAIGGARVKGLDDYVRVSKGLKGQGGAVTVEYVRDGIAHNAELTLHSAPLRQKWGVRIIPWREGRAKQGADYWLERAAAQIKENERKGKAKVGPEDHGKVLLSLFTALDANPESLNTATRIGRHYGELAACYHKQGERKKAIWCLRRSLQLFGNSLQKASSIQELVYVKKGLEDLQKTMAAMK